jgi:hypothetical protein
VRGRARDGDRYFIYEGLSFPALGGTPLDTLSKFFGIERDQAQAMFTASGYSGGVWRLGGPNPTPADVIAKVQVILMEKRPNESSEGFLTTRAAREPEPVSEEL